MDANRGTSAAAVPLEYAPAPPRWRRRMRRWIWLFVLCGVGAAMWWWHADLWNRAQLLYWQQRCLNYSAPADMIACTNDPDSADKMYLYLNLPGTAHRTPIEWIRLKQIANFVMPPLPPPPRPSPLPKLQFQDVPLGNVCFLGELRTPSGQRHLVAVECDQAVGTMLEEPMIFSLHAYSITPGIVQRPSNPRLSTSTATLAPPSSDPATFTLFAGQRDSNDASHLTIRCVVNGTPNLIEAWLKDNGNIEFTPPRPIGKPATGK